MAILRFAIPLICAVLLVNSFALMPAHAANSLLVREEIVTLDAYPYDSFWSDVLDSTFNIAYKKFDANAYHSTPRTTSPRQFKTVILENNFLRLTFLPELGGRLWQVLFKPTNQTLFYQNRVLKPSPWGPTQQGGWLAVGGMEWALPVDEHGYEWGVPWSYVTAQSATQATITLQDSTATNRVRARIEIILPADAAYFIVHPRIENPTSTPTRLQFWINAQIALNTKNVSPDTEFIFPARQVFVHSTGDAFIPSQYIPRNGARAPATPMPWSTVAGRDLARYRDWENYLGIFSATNDPAATFATSFVGAYNHANELGIARVFPRASAPGVKLFAFGPWFSERNAFADDGSDYFEIWGGLPRTFFRDDDATLAASSAREWSEFWIPFAGTGGLTDANRSAVLNWQVDANGNAMAGVAATTRGTRGTLALWRDGALVQRWQVALEPGNAFRAYLHVPPQKNYRLTFFSNQVNVLGTP